MVNEKNGFVAENLEESIAPPAIGDGVIVGPIVEATVHVAVIIAMGVGPYIPPYYLP